MQVCSYDGWDRYTSEGYGWLALGPELCPGSSTCRVATWQPLGTIRDKMAAFFTGGSRELADMRWVMGRCCSSHKIHTSTQWIVHVHANSVLCRSNMHLSSAWWDAAAMSALAHQPCLSKLVHFPRGGLVTPQRAW